MDTPETGVQPLTYTDVFLGEDPADCDEVTFFIPAFSGTRFGYERLSRELAEKGSRVIGFDYPDSHLGEPQETFTEKVKESNKQDEPVNYDPHTTLFKKAITELVEQINSDGKERKITIYSYSTGCPILAEALNDPEFSKVVNNAVLLSPASAVDQNLIKLGAGFHTEIFSILRYEGSEDGAEHLFGTLENLVNTGIVTGPRIQEGKVGGEVGGGEQGGGGVKDERETKSVVNGEKIEEEVDSETIIQRRGEISGVLIKKVCRKSNAFDTARVAEGGTIIVQTGGLDMATKSKRAIPEWLAANDQMISLRCKWWSHVSPVYFAQQLVPQVDRLIEERPVERGQTFSVN